jgi:hypothetical protein
MSSPANLGTERQVHHGHEPIHSPGVEHQAAKP